MRQYSIDQVELAWLGLDFKEGLAAGTSIQEARTSPSWSYKAAGAVSKGYRAYSPDRSGTLTVTVDQEAQLHNQLIAIAEADANPSTRTQVGNMVITDTSSGFRMTYKNAYITTIPDEARAVESLTFPWIFQFEDYEKTEVPTLANAVGN
jgi:hypothetical protein